MNRQIYLEQIQMWLGVLVQLVKGSVKAGYYDVNKHCENLFRDLFNILYGKGFYNLNTKKPNFPGVDLANDNLKVVIQVTSSATKTKVDHTFDKTSRDLFKGYRLRMLFLVDDAEKLKDYIPYGAEDFNFDSSKDILDICALIKEIENQTTDVIQQIGLVLDKELRPGLPSKRKSKNILADVLKILSEKPISQTVENDIPKFFKLKEKIQINDLSDRKDLIDDAMSYVPALLQTYKEMELLHPGAHQRVLSLVLRTFSNIKTDGSTCEKFKKLEEDLMEMLRNDLDEDLNEDSSVITTVAAVVVDAFALCKIFKAPWEAS